VRAGRLAALAIALSGGACSEPVRPSTRAVTIEVASGEARGEQAAGFVLSRGRVVTVAHLVEDDARLSVRADDEQTRRARVLRLDRRADLALLAVPGLPAADRARIAAPDAASRAGSTLRLLLPGHASARQARIRRAIDARLRSATGGPAHRRSGVELEAAVARGDSGAPLVTAGGEVAGVLFARSRKRPNTAYAVDATELRRFLRHRRAL
jgi:S1-C subfamily serine protease